MADRTCTCLDCGVSWIEPHRTGPIRVRCVPCNAEFKRIRARDLMRARRAADPVGEAAKQAASARARRLANPEKAREAGRQSYRRNRTVSIAASKRWQVANADRIAARRDEINRVHRENYARNLEHSREVKRRIEAQRRARARGALTIPFSAEQLDARLSMFSACWMCGAEWSHVDHVKPLSKGGAHILANLRPSCARCNLRKSATWPLASTRPMNRKRTEK